MKNPTVLYALIAGYGFGLLTAFMCAAVYEAEPRELMVAALLGGMMVIAAVAGNEAEKRSKDE